jgi:hypothetical protein
MPDPADTPPCEPFEPRKARQLIKEILQGGRFTYSQHATREMAKDKLDTVDCVNVLRAGVVDPPEMECGTWRYRVRTQRITVVVAFRGTTECVVVTAWRV